MRLRTRRHLPGSGIEDGDGDEEDEEGACGGGAAAVPQSQRRRVPSSDDESRARDRGKDGSIASAEEEEEFCVLRCCSDPPLWQKSTKVTAAVCPTRTEIGLPGPARVAPQTRTVPSTLDDATAAPSEDTERSVISPWCPRQTLSSRAVAESHARTVRSSEPVNTSEPQRLKATQ